MRKILTKLITEVYYPMENWDKPKGGFKGIRGSNDPLYIDQHILKKQKQRGKIFSCL